MSHSLYSLSLHRHLGHTSQLFLSFIGTWNVIKRKIILVGLSKVVNFFQGTLKDFGLYAARKTPSSVLTLVSERLVTRDYRESMNCKTTMTLLPAMHIRSIIMKPKHGLQVSVSLYDKPN